MIQTTTLPELKNTIASIVRRSIPDIPVQLDWRREQFFGRCTAPMLLLSLTSMKAEDGGFYGTSGHTSSSYYEENGTQAECVVRLTLFLPRDSLSDAENLLERACAALAAAEEGDFYAFSFAPLRFQEHLQSFEASLDISCRILLLRKTETIPLNGLHLIADPT